MIVFPNCKINLGLHILHKRADGFHDLETIFYPVALHDALEIVPSLSPVADIKFSSSGLEIPSTSEQNSCLKAYRLLKKDIPGLPVIKMHLHKAIPSGAGLGGGSSDGAFTLALLNKKFNLELSHDRLLNYALQLGSDCPFFIKNQPCYATGRGEILDELELNLSGYKIVLVNPKIHIGRAQAFSKIIPDNKRTNIKDIIKKPVAQWRDVLKNDFEESVFNEHPEIRAIKHKLYEQGAVYASMSGSGSTVYGLFELNKQPQLHFPAHYFIEVL
jgi:4-diphosphocytidyl-2-C-methyl-D-erythritol kinase